MRHCRHWQKVSFAARALVTQRDGGLREMLDKWWANISNWPFLLLETVIWATLCWASLHDGSHQLALICSARLPRVSALWPSSAIGPPFLKPTYLKVQWFTYWTEVKVKHEVKIVQRQYNFRFFFATWPETCDKVSTGVWWEELRREGWGIDKGIGWERTFMHHGPESFLIWRTKDLLFRFRAPQVLLVTTLVTFSRIKPNNLHDKFILCYNLCVFRLSTTISIQTQSIEY